jgi:Universal stress protein family
MNTVVVGVDQSSFAADALRWAIQYAAPHDKAVTAIMAWSHPGDNGADPARAELRRTARLDSSWTASSIIAWAVRTSR